MSNHTIAVIGGGAAGLMAAGFAAEQGARVLLFETNPKVGRKIYITGKGRCNVTNNCDVQQVLANVPVNPRFLYSALGQFSPADVMEFFEAHGVPLKTERGNRVFPVSDKAADIVDALFSYVKKQGVQLIFHSVQRILTENGAVSGVEADGKIYPADRVIIATGGASYPATGSTGDGYRFARECGHTVVPPRPSLVPLVEAGDLCQQLMGLSLKNVTLSVFENNKKIFEDFGEMLFTHFGLSGPLVLSASAHMRHFGSKSYHIEIDLKPALDEKTLDKRLLSDFEKHKNSDFINALGDLLPRKLIPVIVQCAEIDPRVKVHSITKAQRQNLLRLLKHFPIVISGARPIAEAIVTTGGVSVKEVNPKTMQSKKLPGLYFAGEVLDVDAYTGGFNLQIAWATGRLAGLSAANDD
ncbi:MAG: NAD(P)/FAD-dependent oxidoreductase [Butyricicoccus sp.]